MKTKKKEFTVWFHGETKVKAYTKEEAKAQVEQSKNIKSNGSIKTESTWYWIQRGFVINAGAIFTTFCMIIMINIWSNSLDQVQNLPEEFKILGILIWIVFLMSTMKFPTLIGGWYEP